jgi:hypothetical protein
MMIEPKLRVEKVSARIEFSGLECVLEQAVTPDFQYLQSLPWVIQPEVVKFLVNACTLGWASVRVLLT